jgi:hypothetical protein
MISIQTAAASALPAGLALARGVGHRRPARQRAEIARRSGRVIDHDLTQRAFTTILEQFVETGRAPHYAELADALDIGPEEAREVQRAAVEAAPIASCWLAHDTDFIESWAPFSNVPTHYLISVDGIQKWYGQ